MAQGNEDTGGVGSVPIHKTDEFKNSIKRIKERDAMQQAAAASPVPSNLPAKPVQFNITAPMPSSMLPPKKSLPHHGSSFNTKLYESELEKVVRKQVNNEFAGTQPPMGMDRSYIKKSIEKKITERMDIIKNPRYVFLSDGTPFLMTKKDERAELEKSLIGESLFKKRWIMAKYDIANGIGKVAEWVNEGAMRTKEILTDDTIEGNVIGSVAQLGYNSALLGVEYLRAANSWQYVTDEKIAAVRNEAEALKYTDPVRATEALQKAKNLEAQQEINKEVESRIKLAKQAVNNSWASLQQERSEQQDMPYLGSGSGPMRMAYFNKLAEEEKLADNEAVALRNQALTAYSQGNYEQALQLTRQAQDADRHGSNSDYYGAYTWIREPERYDKFKEDAAFLELQKGAPLDKEEIRRLKEYHANSWTEIGGEVLFDPINLVPASIMEKIIKVPFQGIAKASKAVEEAFPLYAKTLNVLGSPVRWLRRQSVTSAASQVATNIHNQLQRINGAYTKSEDMVKALDSLGDFVTEAKAVRTENEARAIFERGKTQVPGLQNITFTDFKQLMDAADHVPAAEGAWGKIFSDAVTKAEDDMTHIAQRLKKDPAQLISDVSKSRRALMTTSNAFKEAFTDAHRIYQGSSFVDDTISGWVTKVMRELSGDEVNDLLKTNKLDEFLTKYSTTLSPKAQMAWKFNRQIVESVLHRTAQLRDFWAKMVLSTPRWIMNNLPDTAMRDVVAGGNLWDDLVTLFSSTQRTLADDLGFVPAELAQKISSAGIDFGSDVPTRLLYDGWKPKAGLFSYIKYEFGRLQNEDHILAKTQIINGMLENMPKGKLKNALANLLDGFSNVPLALNAYADGIGSFNEAIEFTFRLRMFHREYFKLLEQVEPAFLEKGMSSLTPATKEIAKQIWQAAEGNPRRVTAYAEALAGKSVKGTPAEWAFIVPPEIERVTKGMDIADRQVFITSVRSELDSFIQSSTKAGKDLTAEDFNKFFDNYIDKFRDEMQARMSKTHDYRGMDGSIATDGKPNDIPDINSGSGSLPLPTSQAPINDVIEKATNNIKRGKRAATGDIVTDFQTAMSEHAKIETVAGREIRVTTKNGQPVIQIGEEAAKKKATALYDDINEAVIQVFKNTDSDLILRSGFNSVDHYEDTLRKFIDDATAVFHNDERQFLTIVNEMETHPQLKKLLEQTLPKDKVIRYDSTMDVYRDLGVYSDSYGFTRPPEQVFEDVAQSLRPVPGAHVAAAHNMGIATRQLADHAKTLTPELAAKVNAFLDPFTVYREELKQVYAFLYPGPLLKSTTGEGRHAAWELFYKMSENEFTKEAEIKKTLLTLLQNDPEKAAKYMDDANADFVTYFLKQQGVTLEWDANKEVLMNVKIITPNGAKNFTERRDLAYVQRRLFTNDINKKLAENPLIRITNDIKLQMKKQLRNALRDTFDIPTRHADAWATAIDSHAQKWAEITGQPIEKYYERLGFQRLEGEATQGLAVKENFRVTKRGAVSRTPDGGFTFYGLGQSNFEAMVRETGELFYDDLVSMAEHNPQSADDLAAIKALIEEKTNKKIKGNRLEKVHSDALSEMFTSYVHTGQGPNIKVKGGLEKFKTWLSSTFDAVRDTPITGEMTDDTFRVLDRLFNEQQLQDVPKISKRKVKVIAKEMGINFETDDDLLKIINEELHPGATSPDLNTLAPEQLAQRTELENKWRMAEQEYRSLVDDAAGMAGDNATANSMIGNDPRIQQAEENMQQASKALNEFDSSVTTVVPPTFKSLDEVPTDVLKQVLKGGKESQIEKELSEGWDAWKTQRGLVGFPDEALSSVDTFKEYLRTRSANEWSEVSNYYNRLSWEVEQFENAMLNYHAGDEFADVFFPRVHEANISNGMKTFIRNQEHMTNNYESALTALDTWKQHMAKMADGGHPAFVLPKEAQTELLTWAKGAATDKAEMLDVLIHGGDFNGQVVEGALDKTNRFMLDYQHTSIFDQTMKNFFPFWMFPSRSFPFWAETMATHPQLISNYEKIQRLSRSQRYQAGAVTSQGKPLPSLDGYIQMPGTDLWFNPLAPLSFRYVLDVAKSKDDILYAANSQDEIEPKAFMVREMMETGQIYGFSLAPWMTYLMKQAYNIPNEIIPSYPMIPEISLIPRWMVHDLIQKANKVNLFGMEIQGLGDAVYPEAPWHDYMVERRILENALSQIRSGNLSEADKLKLMNQAQNAIKYKGEDVLWKESYKELTQEEWTRSVSSFFSGMYPKSFGDNQADMLSLRNELNQLKSAMNNEFQSTIFDLPVQSDKAWDNYLNALDTPEGWAHRLYTDIGWVKNGQGELLREPQERNKWLALKIQQDEDQQMYYDKMASLQNEFNERIRALPVGADWKQTQVVYDWYSNERSSLDYLRTFEKVYGTNKPVELIQQDIAKDWFREIGAMKPRWEVTKGETYEDYQQRVTEWETNLPKIAEVFVRAYLRRNDLNKTLDGLHEDQRFDRGVFFTELVGMTNVAGIQEFEKQNDDVFDALNKAWKSTYWDSYWNSVIGKDGYEVDLAEKDFYAKHQEPPSSDELYQWITAYYGPEKFTREEIAKWVDGTDTMSVEERQLATKDDPVDFKKRQDVWDMLSWVGPGNRNRAVFNQAFINAGGDPDMLTVWYEESGQAYKTKPERLDQMREAIQEAIKTLGLKPPERAELVRYVQAQDENEMFKQLINDELGNQFFDWEDENGQVQPGVFSYYNGLDKAAKKEFRSQQPDAYSAIQSYYDMRETFGSEHATWNDYYGVETTPTVSLPTDANGSTFTPPPLRGPVYPKGGGGGGGGGGKPQYSPAQNYAQQDTSYSSGNYFPSFNINDRTATHFSPGLYSLVGSKMAWEITSLFSSGRKISSSGVSFLRSVANRYPQYQAEINSILAKGT